MPVGIRICRLFLQAGADALRRARVFIALGQIAHQSAVRALISRASFAHLAEHSMPGGRILIDSYHCSRYNTNTERLTAVMFEAVIALREMLV